MHVNENTSAEELAGAPDDGGVPDANDSSEHVIAAAVVEATTDPVPDVDELEDRLRDLQGAMDHLQTGDLDGAERAIEALEERMESTRD